MGLQLRMKKRIARDVILAYLLASLLCNMMCFAGPSELTKVYVNGRFINLFATVVDGVAYLPINAMAFNLGVDINYNPKSNIVKVDNNPIGVSPMVRDGKA